MSNLAVKHAVDSDAVIIAAMGEYAMQESPHYRKFEYNPGKAMDALIDKIESDTCLVLTIEESTKHTQHLSLIHISEPTRPY